MTNKKRVDWGICDGCQGVGRLLIPFIHHPSLTAVWLCGECALNAEEALANSQVPGMLDAAVKAAAFSMGL